MEQEEILTALSRGLSKRGYLVIVATPDDPAEVGDIIGNPECDGVVVSQPIKIVAETTRKDFLEHRMICGWTDDAGLKGDEKFFRVTTD